MAKPRTNPSTPEKPKSRASTPDPAPKRPRSRPKPSRTGLLAKPVRVDVEIDRTLKKKWLAALDALEDAKREGAGAFDRQWEAVGAILEHDPPLYLAGGLSTNKAFLERHVGENERTARRMVRVAKYASPAEENRFGISKLDAAISFIEAKIGAPIQGRLPVAFDALRIPAGKDNNAEHKPLADTTVEEIHAATRALLRAGKKSPVKASPVVKALTNELSSRALRGVSVRLAGGKVSFSGIPLDAFADFVKGLARVQLPAESE
jgi:hypothetical protein